MKNYSEYFKNKKITVLGLGLLGKRIECIKFFSECGAFVVVTDIKAKKDLLPAIKELKSYKNIVYHLGGHTFTDFENCDFVLKGQGTPLDSPYILHAEKHNIPIEMDESLFLKLAPKNITVIGVTGTRGKTTTTMMIYHTLKKSGIKRVFLGGNIKGTAVLPLLAKIKSGDILVLELSSWQLQGFGQAKISPHIAVFTNFMKDHMNYYHNNVELYFKDKSYIYSFQKKSDSCILGESLSTRIIKNPPVSNIVYVKKNIIPVDWKLHILGEHNLLNASYAYAALKKFGLSKDQIKKGFESFKGVEGRLEFVLKYKDISVYNDTCATTPEALLAALRSFSDRHTVLIAGGATKHLNLKDISNYLSKIHQGELLLLPGSGTDELVSLLEKTKSPALFKIVKNLKEAIRAAFLLSTKGSVILFSPGFTSFGMFKNEYDRGDRFKVLLNGYTTKK